MSIVWVKLNQKVLLKQKNFLRVLPNFRCILKKIFNLLGERNIFERWLRAIGKLDYVQGKDRPNVECIFCSVRDNDERVKSVKVYQDNLIFVCLNLFPYNPGHLMVIPNRHVLRFLDLEKKETIHMSRAIQGLEMLLDELYAPKGYNIGINEGRSAGASIEHLHIHVLPRYGSELGYIDIFGNARVVPEGLDAVKKKVDTLMGKYLNNEFFEKF